MKTKLPAIGLTILLSTAGACTDDDPSVEARRRPAGRDAARSVEKVVADKHRVRSDLLSELWERRSARSDGRIRDLVGRLVELDAELKR